MISGKQPPTILVVDDQPINIRILTNILKDDYRILEARSGRDALEIAAGTDRPDLILLDIRMPEMNGYELCRRLKRDPSTADIPVIMVTAIDEETDHGRGFGVGAVDYITKPVHPVLLQARVRNHLLVHTQKRELREQVARFEREMALAKSFQEHFLPKSTPDSPAFTMSYFHRQKEAIGGDLLDFFEDNQGRIGVMLADVSGHGTPAALIAAILRSYTVKLETETPLGDFLIRLNNELSGIIGNNFVALLLGILNPATHSFRFINAGICHPVHYRSESGDLVYYRENGTALGMFPDIKLPAPQEIFLKPGDRLFLYTDGVIEIPTRDGEEMEARLRDMFHQIRWRPVSEVLDIFQELIMDETNRNPPDDLTCIGISLRDV